MTAIFDSDIFDPEIFDTEIAEPTESLKAILYLSQTATIDNTNYIPLLTDLHLKFSQEKKRHYPSGSLEPSTVIDGKIVFEGSFEKAYANNTLIAAFNQGTKWLLGSICPLGLTKPAIVGTLELVSGALVNGVAGNELQVVERHNFLLFNVSFIDLA